MEHLYDFFWSCKTQGDTQERIAFAATTALAHLQLIYESVQKGIAPKGMEKRGEGLGKGGGMQQWLLIMRKFLDQLPTNCLSV